MASIDKSKFQFVKRDDFASETIDAPAYSYWKSVMRQFFKKKSTVVMLGILIAIVLMSFIYPMFSKFDFNDVSKVNDFSLRYVHPNAQYWFGTDSNGKSLFDSVWFGARNSILIAVIATFLNVIIGLIVGAVWGISKTFDMIMMEIYNIISNIPDLLVVIVLTYSLGSGFWNMIFAMTVTGWIGIAYTIRIQIMRYRDLEYNLASRTLGTPTAKIVVKNIMPQLVSVIVTMASQLLPGFISYEAFLSYFGLGLPVTTPSLGRLISDYAQNVTVNAYLFWIPLTTLILVSLALFIVGQNLADASDPRTHRYESNMTENKNVILSARDIVVAFDVRDRVLTAILGVSLDLVEGEVLALVGESGSGKSVLTKTFTGMLEENGRVASGSIDYRGQDLTKLKSHQDWAPIRGAKIATIFQDPMTSLDPIKTIGSQIVEVIVKHQGKSTKEAKKMAIDYMDKVGIPDAEKRFNEYPFQYSGGMRQRIVIAIALACRPDVLICDEPTTALDVTIQAQIIDLLKSLKEEYGFSVIFITHDLGVVASIADKVAVMYADEIIEYATVEEIFYEPCHPYTWSLLSSLPQLADDKGELFSIPGTPPSLYTPVVGDAFALRSDYAMQIDFEEKAPQFQVSDTHWAKTWLLHEDTPKVEKPAVIQNLHEKIRANMGFAHLGDEEEGDA